MELHDILSAIDKLMCADGRIMVAIDGRAAAGKTTLADMLWKHYDCNIFHMDDFFLPPSKRTAERLREAGGNVDYERFYSEVIVPSTEGRAFSYGVFDCSVMEIGEWRNVVPKKLNIMEGSYSGHPYFGDVYDLRVFVDIPADEQMKRIIHRNGEEKAQKFRDIWIPMENKYFRECRIKERSHIIIE